MLLVGRVLSIGTPRERFSQNLQELNGGTAKSMG